MAFGNGPRVVTDGLVLSYDFSDRNCYISGSTTSIDLTRIGSNGTLENNPSFDTGSGGNLSLDGTNDRVLITCASNTIRSYDMTCQFIVKLPLYSGGQRCILSYRGGGGGGGLYIGKNSGGIFTFYTGATPAGYTVGNIPDGSIIIAAVVLDGTGGNVSVYINGTLAGIATGRTGFSTAYNSTMYLGFDNGGTNEYMLGNFYSFMHYNKILSASEILQNYNALKSRFSL